jgi:hypothetical protein
MDRFLVKVFIASQAHPDPYTTAALRLNSKINLSKDPHVLIMALDKSEFSLGKIPPSLDLGDRLFQNKS